MKSKKVRRIILRIVLVSLGVGLLGGVSFYMYQVSALWLHEQFIPESLTISYKHIHSPSQQKKIEACIQKELADTSFADIDYSKLFKKLRDTFKVIKKVSWRWNFFEHASLEVEGVKPLFFLNDAFVLGNKKRLFLPEEFSDFSTKNLRPVYIHQTLCGQKISKSIHRFLQTIPNHYWDLYTVNYKDKYYILLQTKNNLALTCVVDRVTLFDQEKLAVAERLYDEFVTKKNVYHRKSFMKNKHVLCDLRFKDRIYARLVRT